MFCATIKIINTSLTRNQKKIFLIHANLLTPTVLSLLLRKGVYPYEYINDWEKISETPEKEDFYRHLNIEDITDVYYAHAKRV